MKSLSLNDVKKLPPLSDHEINDVLNFVNTDFSDCPKQTPEELAQYKTLKELKPDVYNALVNMDKSTK